MSLVGCVLSVQFLTADVYCLICLVYARSLVSCLQLWKSYKNHPDGTKYHIWIKNQKLLA